MDWSASGSGEIALAAGMVFAILFLFLISTVIHVLIYCKIFAKAGYHWAYGLLILVPVAQLIVPFYLAFADWPAQRELRELRQRTGQTQGDRQW